MSFISSDSNEINQILQLSQDFSQFLFSDQLSDIKLKVRKSNSKFESISLQEIENSEQLDETQQTKLFTLIPAHKVILAARCQYFQSKFCGEWKDGTAQVSNFSDFTENSMREFLKYIYTGKLKLDTSNILGILKVASFFSMEELCYQCKQFLSSEYLNAFDLCMLFCDLRDQSQDFAEMKEFLTQIIPEKVDINIICKVLKEIWIPKSENQIEEDLNILVNQDSLNQDDSIEQKDEQIEIEDKLGNEEKKQEFEIRESIDLQDILIEQLQKNIPTIIDDPKLKVDFFDLPQSCLQYILSCSNSCVSEILMFKAIEEQLFKIKSDDSLNEQTKFYKQLLNLIRLPLINIKSLVTDIKFSSFYSDEQIFKAIQFSVAKNLFTKEQCMNNLEFQTRGMKCQFDLLHQDIQANFNQEQGSYLIKRVQSCQETEHSYISAMIKDPLPLHGIHYWEIKIKAQTQQTLKQVFVGLCNQKENTLLENTHRSKLSVLLNCYDSSFWNNGQQVQVFSNKFVKIKQPIKHTDVIRIAFDLRHAKEYKQYWQEGISQQVQREEDQQHSTHSTPLRSSRNSTSMQRLRDNIRMINVRDHNLSLYLNNEFMYMNSKCKYHFAFNNSEFHEGIDLNLVNIKESPLNFVVCLLEQDVEVELSKAVYFDDWDLIPKEPFLMNV